MKAEIITKISKKTGKEFKALKITLGLYETLVFPNSLELDYIEKYLVKNAHEDFQGDLDVSED